MNEFISIAAGKKTSRASLLMTVSALAIIAVGADAHGVRAGEDSHPSVWIELGGQLERIDRHDERYMPPFTDSLVQAGLISPAEAQTPPRYGQGGEAKFVIEPQGSDWTFSAAIRYGRSNGAKHIHQQFSSHYTYNIIIGGHVVLSAPIAENRFSDTHASNVESHALLDFNVGKDVGLGLFGRYGTSNLSAGVRLAQFTSSSIANIFGRPDYNIHSYLFVGRYHIPGGSHHDYHATGKLSRNFHGIGPTVSWDASVALLTDSDDERITFDWGAGAGILFGRQKASGNQTTSEYRYRWAGGGFNRHTYNELYHHSDSHDRDRSVVVPNVGGQAALSLNWPNAKVSFGYRVDFFFGAIDGGIDTQQSQDIGFYGPFATVSIGLGG
jgi:hypothetical protein